MSCRARRAPLSNEISKRFSAAEEQAREELQLTQGQGWDTENQQRIAERADEILRLTPDYKELYQKLDPLQKRLAPLCAKYAMHGFVWVYLRK